MGKEIDYTELLAEDIQIGAVEIKDATTDLRANVVPTIFGNGLVTKSEVSITPTIPRTPTILNVNVPSHTWTLITDLPDNVIEWTIKARSPNVEFRISYTYPPTTYLTLWPGSVISHNTNPRTIYVYQETYENQIIELEYWTL